MRPREAEDEVETPRRGRRPGHAHLPDMYGEGLGAVGEGDRALAGGIEDFKEVHPRGDEADAELLSLRPEAEARPEEEGGEEGEGE